MLLWTIVAIIAALAALAVYAVGIEPRWLRVRRRTLYLPGWDPALNGLTILHLSDLHIRRRPTQVDSFLRRAQRLQADLIVVTGDFITGPRDLERACRLLKEVVAGREAYGVTGNHEHAIYGLALAITGNWSARKPIDAGPIVRMLEGTGVRMLENRCLTLVRGVGRFTLAGIGDAFTGADDLHAALDGASRDAPIVLLSHSPDVLEDAAQQSVALVLSGHTHAGTIHFPGLGTPTTLTKKPLERPAGVIWRGSTAMHVSPGMGLSNIPVRFFARPEATVLELRRGVPKEVSE